MFTSSAGPRFLRYVTYDTQSDENAKTYPSTDKQLVLLRDLADELRGLGLADAVVDEFGYVMATIPSTTPRAGVPTIGFIAHVDTSPEMSGAGVKPLVHSPYAVQCDPVSRSTSSVASAFATLKVNAFPAAFATNAVVVSDRGWCTTMTAVRPTMSFTTRTRRNASSGNALLAPSTSRPRTIVLGFSRSS